MFLGILLVGYEFLWITFIYVGLYWCVDKFMTNHAQVMKVAFDLDIRYFLYTSKRDRHDILYVISALLAFVVMTINPLVYSVIFFWFNFLDICQLNRVVLCVSYLRLARGVNLLNRNVDSVHWWALFQLIYTSLNFWNRETIIPSLFYLFDELSVLESDLGAVLKLYGKLINVDSSFSSWLMAIKVWMIKHRKILGTVHLLVLGLLCLFSVLWSHFRTFSEFVFIYASTYRVVHLAANR